MAASGIGASSGAPETENCSDIRLLLSALVDNEATPEEAARAKAHIPSCAGCASHYAFLRLTSRALSQAPEVYPSASLSARIAAATYDRPTLAERIAGWLRPAPVRVGIGAAVAAGLAMALIVPRVSEVDTAALTPPSQKGAPIPKGKSTRGTTAKVAKTPPPKSPAKAPKVAVLTDSRPGTTGAAALPATKAATAAVQPPVLAARKPAPIAVAEISPRRAIDALTTVGPASLSASDIIQGTRTEPRTDRGQILRPHSLGLKRPGTENITILRSGYNRGAATEKRLHTNEVAASAASAALAASLPNPSGISPILSESTAGKLVEPSSAVAERVAPRPPVESTAVSVASAAVVEAPPQRADGKLRIRLNNRRGDKAAVLPVFNASPRGAGSLSASDRYSFGSGSVAHIDITSAPVTGIN